MPTEIELPAGWENWSLKRAAWAFGCSKKGTKEHQALKLVLIALVRDLDQEGNEHP